MWDLRWIKWYSGVFPSVSFHYGSPYSYIIWVTNNRPLHGHSSQTQSHTTDINNNKTNNSYKNNDVVWAYDK